MKGNTEIFDNASEENLEKIKSYTYEVVFCGHEHIYPPFICPKISCIFLLLLQINLGKVNSDKADNNDNKDDIIISLKLLHIIIIFNDNHLVRNIIEKNIPIEMWMATTSVAPKPSKSINNFECDWIDNATCYHLAAKFNPKGLHLLLEKLKEASKDEFDKLYEGDKVSPLHVAALNSNSIGLR